MDVTTSSTSYPSQYTFPKRNDFCLVIRKIDKICQVGNCLSQQHNIFYLLQDNFKKIVFERHYRGRFSCATFPADIRRKCRENPRNVITSPPAQEAATEYARENLALIKIFIRLVVVLRGNISPTENSEVMTVSLLLVLRPVRWADVVRRSQDVQEGGRTTHTLNSKTEDKSPLDFPPH